MAVYAMALKESKDSNGIVFKTNKSSLEEAKDYFKQLRVIYYERDRMLKKDNIDKFLQEGGDIKSLQENRFYVSHYS